MPNLDLSNWLQKNEISIENLRSIDINKLDENTKKLIYTQLKNYIQEKWWIDNITNIAKNDNYLCTLLQIYWKTKWVYNWKIDSYYWPWTQKVINYIKSNDPNINFEQTSEQPTQFDEHIVELWDTLWKIISQKFPKEKSNTNIAKLIESIVDFNIKNTQNKNFIERLQKDIYIVKDNKVYNWQDWIRWDLLYVWDKILFPKNIQDITNNIDWIKIENWVISENFSWNLTNQDWTSPTIVPPTTNFVIPLPKPNQSTTTQIDTSPQISQDPEKYQKDWKIKKLYNEILSKVNQVIWVYDTSILLKTFENSPNIQNPYIITNIRWFEFKIDINENLWVNIVCWDYRFIFSRNYYNNNIWYEILEKLVFYIENVNRWISFNRQITNLAWDLMWMFIDNNKSNFSIKPYLVKKWSTSYLSPYIEIFYNWQYVWIVWVNEFWSVKYFDSHQSKNIWKIDWINNDKKLYDLIVWIVENQNPQTPSAPNQNTIDTNRLIEIQNIVSEKNKKIDLLYSNIYEYYSKKTNLTNNIKIEKQYIDISNYDKQPVLNLEYKWKKVELRVDESWLVNIKYWEYEKNYWNIYQQDVWQHIIFVITYYIDKISENEKYNQVLEGLNNWFIWFLKNKNISNIETKFYATQYWVTNNTSPFIYFNYNWKSFSLFIENDIEIYVSEWWNYTNKKRILYKNNQNLYQDIYDFIIWKQQPIVSPTSPSIDNEKIIQSQIDIIKIMYWVDDEQAKQYLENPDNTILKWFEWNDLFKMYWIDRFQYVNYSQIDFSQIPTQKIEIPDDLENSFSRDLEYDRKKLQNSDKFHSQILEEAQKLWKTENDLKTLWTKEILELWMQIVMNRITYSLVDDKDNPINQQYWAHLPSDVYFDIWFWDCDKYAMIYILVIQYFKTLNPNLQNVYVSTWDLWWDQLKIRHARNSIFIVTKDGIKISHIDLTFKDNWWEFEAKMWYHIPSTKYEILANLFKEFSNYKAAIDLNFIALYKSIEQNDTNHTKNLLNKLCFYFYITNDLVLMWKVSKIFESLNIEKFEDFYYYGFLTNIQNKRFAEAKLMKDALYTKFPHSGIVEYMNKPETIEKWKKLFPNMREYFEYEKSISNWIV